MKIHCYAKQNEDMSTFESVINLIKSDQDDVFLTMENKRSFREFEKLPLEDKDSVFVVSSLSSLGLNDADIANRLSLFVDNFAMLVVVEIPSTYEFGVSQPMNQAIVSTLLHSILSGNKNIVAVDFKRNNSGRSRIPFPNNWNELYEKWERNEISSKEFIKLAGVKKATFYNLVTEYKDIQKQNQNFLQKYRIG